MHLLRQFNCRGICKTMTWCGNYLWSKTRAKPAYDRTLAESITTMKSLTKALGGTAMQAEQNKPSEKISKSCWGFSKRSVPNSNWILWQDSISNSGTLLGTFPKWWRQWVHDLGRRWPANARHGDDAYVVGSARLRRDHWPSALPWGAWWGMA